MRIKKRAIHYYGLMGILLCMHSAFPMFGGDPQGDKGSHSNKGFFLHRVISKGWDCVKEGAENLYSLGKKTCPSILRSEEPALSSEDLPSLREKTFSEKSSYEQNEYKITINSLSHYEQNAIATNSLNNHEQNGIMTEPVEKKEKVTSRFSGYTKWALSLFILMSMTNSVSASPEVNSLSSDFLANDDLFCKNLPFSQYSQDLFFQEEEIGSFQRDATQIETSFLLSIRDQEPTDHLTMQLMHMSLEDSQENNVLPFDRLWQSPQGDRIKEGDQGDLAMMTHQGDWKSLPIKLYESKGVERGYFVTPDDKRLSKENHELILYFPWEIRGLPLEKKGSGQEVSSLKKFPKKESFLGKKCHLMEQDPDGLWMWRDEMGDWIKDLDGKGRLAVKEVDGQWTELQGKVYENEGKLTFYGLNRQGLKIRVHNGNLERYSSWQIPGIPLATDGSYDAYEALVEKRSKLLEKVPSSPQESVENTMTEAQIQDQIQNFEDGGLAGKNAESKVPEEQVNTERDASPEESPSWWDVVRNIIVDDFNEMMAPVKNKVSPGDTVLETVWNVIVDDFNEQIEYLENAFENHKKSMAKFYNEE